MSMLVKMTEVKREERCTLATRKKKKQQSLAGGLSWSNEMGTESSGLV